MELWDNTNDSYQQVMPNNLKGILEFEELYEVINDYFSKLPKKENLINYFDFYFKYIYNEDELKEKFRRNVEFILSFCKVSGLNDIIFFNSMGDFLYIKLKNRKNYFSFDEKNDSWFGILTEEHYVNKKGYDNKSNLPPYGKYFCGSHPSLNPTKNKLSLTLSSFSSTQLKSSLNILSFELPPPAILISLRFNLSAIFFENLFSSCSLTI